MIYNKKKQEIGEIIFYNSGSQTNQIIPSLLYTNCYINHSFIIHFLRDYKKDSFQPNLSTVSTVLQYNIKLKQKKHNGQASLVWSTTQNQLSMSTYAINGNSQVIQIHKHIRRRMEICLELQSLKKNIVNILQRIGLEICE